MVSYYLLRDNQESGPYTLAELKAKVLFTTDLVWIEGESICWKHPAEIPGLESVRLTEKTSPPRKTSWRSGSYPRALYPEQSNVNVSPTGNHLPSNPVPEENYQPSFEALKQKYAQKPPQKRVWRRQINIGANLIGMATLFIGLGLSAYMVKKAVENIEFEPVIASAASAEAVAIEPDVLPSSTGTHAAFASSVPLPENSRLLPDTTTRKEVTPAKANPITEPLPQTAVTMQTGYGDPLSGEHSTAVKKEDDTVPAMTGTAVNSSHHTNESAQPAQDPAALQTNAKEPVEIKTEAEEKEDKSTAKPSLRLSANKYNVGFLGGISNLELSVSNPSAQEVSKALVEVEYLRPNGKVVDSHTVTVSGIAPGSSKTVPVPDNKRGVSVRYKVVKIES